MEELLKKNANIDETLKALKDARKNKNREEERELRTKMDRLVSSGIEVALKNVRDIINGEYKILVISAELLGKCLEWDDLTTSQIRNIFGDVKKMEMKGFREKEFLLLKPKLAYAASRPGAKKGTRELKNVLTMAVNAVGDDEKKFENFCNFFEAILAYHRAAGGK